MGAAAVALAFVVVAVAGDGIIDRATEGRTSVSEGTIAAPDADVLDDLPRATPPPPPPPVTEPTCAEGGAQACFSWTVEAATEKGFDAVVAGGDLVVTTERGDDHVTARRIRDGEIVWQEADGPTFGGHVYVADDLVLLQSTDGTLIARELGTGVERWRSDALAGMGTRQVAHTGETLLLVGEDRAATGDDRPPWLALAAGLDADTGELLWQQPGGNISLGRDAAVVISEEGHVQVHDADGSLRWGSDEPVDEPRHASAWAEGHVVTIHAGGENASLRLLSDGTQLPFAGYPITSDEDHTLVRLADEDGPPFGSATDGLLLVGDAGEVWRNEDLDPMDCLSSIDLEATTVVFSGCEGQELVLDRGDGSVRSRSEPSRLPRRRIDAGRGPVVGPYQLVESRPESGDGDVIVEHVHEAAEIARMPPQSWPLWDEPAGEMDHDGTMVLRGHRWLAALPLPTEPASEAVERPAR